MWGAYNTVIGRDFYARCSVVLSSQCRAVCLGWHARAARAARILSVLLPRVKDDHWSKVTQRANSWGTVRTVCEAVGDFFSVVVCKTSLCSATMYMSRYVRQLLYFWALPVSEKQRVVDIRSNNSIRMHKQLGLSMMAIFLSALELVRTAWWPWFAFFASAVCNEKWEGNESQSAWCRVGKWSNLTGRKPQNVTAYIEVLMKSKILQNKISCDFELDICIRLICLWIRYLLCLTS